MVNDRLIDIVTTGARSGVPRTTEIWSTNVDGRIVICGTPTAGGSPGPRVKRDWLANLRAHPQFVFRLKGSIHLDLPAEAELIRDLDRRRAVALAPATACYREHAESVDVIVRDSPMAEVQFTGDYEWLNPGRDLPG